MVDPQKIQAVKEWARPTSVIEIRSFVGLASYYCQFVKGQRRWIELLKDYDITILYHLGKADVVADVVADALSRKSTSKVLACVEARSSFLKQIKAKQFEDAKVKYEHQKPESTLQRMPILEWKWERIVMDFVVGLRKTLGKFHSIWVIVDRLTKSAHFVPVKITYDAEKLAKVYIREVLRLHRVPISIVSDRGTTFTSRSPIGWFDAFEVRPWGTDLLRESLEKLKVIQAKPLAAQNRQKEYADSKVRDLEFEEEEQVLLKVSPMKGVMRFGKNVLLDENPSYEEEPTAILDRDVRKLRSKEIASVKVKWENRPVEEATWETEADMRSKYPQLFAESGFMPLFLCDLICSGCIVMRS
ncbi:uncharacterized protein LOC132061270 [Lycium ferocissimum]|uniref:uncharacterized protein LOC132061270 n=1 Tax=Lycium ferocissimum TaxID=112874 RepID=UPI002815F3DC|nr:uncharacterized protein LOC132061270 [Lycium ferocissimum]